MIEKIPSPNKGFKLEWQLTAKNTTFSWMKLYQWIHYYLDENGWGDLQTGKDNYETFHSDVENPDGTKNQLYWFRASKFPLGGGAGYLKLYFKMDMQTTRVQTKEVMHKGNKIKLDNGEFKFTTTFWFAEERDAGTGEKSEWNTNKTLKFFKTKFWKRINPVPIKACKGELAKYSDEMYQYIQMYTGLIPQSGPKEYFTELKGTGE